MSEACVFIIDDDPAVRDALVTLIDSVGLQARSFGDADSFLRDYRDQPGCLICDICLPGMDGMQLQQLMLERQIPLPLIAISAHGDIPMAVSMLRRGALDFIEKPFRNHTVLKRVNEAIAHDVKQRDQQARQQQLQQRLERLTPRERDLLPLLTEGLSNKRIALEFKLSPRTVEAHRANILKKMKVDSVTALAQLLA